MSDLILVLVFVATVVGAFVLGSALGGHIGAGVALALVLVAWGGICGWQTGGPIGER